MLWVPVLIAVGIGLYFSLPEEPDFLFNCVALLTAIASFILGKLRQQNIFYSPFWVVAGFFLALFHAYLAQAPVWQGESRPQWIRGTVETIEPLERGYRLKLSDVDIWKIPAEETPAYIRLKTHALPSEIQSGNRISVRASIRRPPQASYAGGYDFARGAYFEKLGAVGYAVNTPKCMDCRGEKNTSFMQQMERLRNNVHKKLMAAAGQDSTPEAPPAIASALLTGLRADIPKKELEAIRIAGLGHLLAISGLHMVMVAMALFMILRYVLALMPRIVLYHNTKKWAAAMAMGFAGFYLLLAGTPVSAQRAFIMLSFFFLALLLDRPGTPLRPVAWAAIGVLFISPQALLTPSFQMSFAAALALVASFHALRRKKHVVPKKGMLRKILFYFAAVVFSSLVAGIATMPFAVYHFGRPAPYGVLANLFAIPLTTFIIMPSGLLSLFLMPLGLEWLSLPVMFSAISWMVAVAENIAALPGSSVAAAKPATLTMVLLVFGALWLIIEKTRWRFAGVGMILLALVSYPFFSARADLVVDGTGKLFAVRTASGEYYFSTRSKARFARGEWEKILGITRTQKISDKKTNAEDLLPWRCNKESCFLKAEGYEAISVQWKEGPPLKCTEDMRLVLLFEPAQPCTGAKEVITLKKLAQEGTHRFTLKKGDYQKETVKEKSGIRRWTAAPNLPKNNADNLRAETTP